MGNNVYDLKNFDEMGRDLYWSTPNVIQSADLKNAFIYKTCGSDWEMTPETFAHTKIKDVKFDFEGFHGRSRTAYWMEDGKVKYTFSNAIITQNKNDIHANSDGFELTWTSKEVCEGDQKFTFTIETDCDKTRPAEGAFTWLIRSPFTDVLQLDEEPAPAADPAPAPAPPATATPVCSRRVQY